MGLVDEADRYLRDCGIDDPAPDIKLLAAFAAGSPIARALGRPLPDLAGPAEAKFRRLVARRGEGREPVAYLVGSAGFMGLELEVSPSVLIPRPSTETLVECAGCPKTFLDIGTGSGAIAIALALRGAGGAATDLSDRALAIARRNAERLGVAGRITFVKSDLFHGGPYDVLVANPPYVSTAEFPGLQPEVLHEPRPALDGGADGLEVIRRIIARAREHAPRLVLEHAPGQAQSVRELALQAGFRDVRTVKDLEGHPRVLEAT
jgi:release factor glutamine methyltransferase